MSKIIVDQTTGEIIQNQITIEVEQALTISIDAEMVRSYHHDPKFIAEQIAFQAGSPVFDISTAKGKKECASHAAKVIKTISPIMEISKGMAAEAKKIVNQDLSFRRDIEPMIRSIASEIRKPLTELETEQKRLEEEQLERERIRHEAEQYELDWQDAIERDELYTLRKASELAKQIAEAEAKAIADKIAFDEAVARKAEQQRDELEKQSRLKFEREQSEKLEAEREEIRKQEREKAEAESKIIRDEEIRIANIVRKEQQEERDRIELEAKEKSDRLDSLHIDEQINNACFEDEQIPEFSREEVIELVMDKFRMDFLDAEQALYEAFRYG